MLKLTLVTPERKVLTNLEVEEVTVPAFRGELNILEGHAPIVTTLSTGIMTWKIKGESVRHKVVVSWGYCEVNPSRISVLADVIDQADDISEKVALERIAEGEAKLAAGDLTQDQFEDAQRQAARGRYDLNLIGKEAP